MGDGGGAGGEPGGSGHGARGRGPSRLGVRGLRGVLEELRRRYGHVRLLDEDVGDGDLWRRRGW